MTQPQPGWYPDPADASRQRYWAGDAWTAETRTPSPDPYASYAKQAAATPVYKGPAATVMPVYVAATPATADGVPLANWGWRFLAYLIDGLVLGVVNMVVFFLTPGLMTGITAWVNDVMGAASSGNFSGQLPSLFDPAYGIAKALTIYEAISIVLACLYAWAMLGLVGSTLGQLACGLRVVPVDQGQHKGGLPGYNVVMRLLFYTLLPSCLSLIGMFMVFGGNLTGDMISLIGSGYLLLSCLWVAWDPKRQGIHDKIARTQVVRPGR